MTGITSEMDPHQVRAHFEARKDAAIESIRQLVEIESPSFNVDGSRAVAAWIEARAKEIQLDLLIERVKENDVGEHILIRAFNDDRRPFLLLGHTDTVHPIDTKLKNPTRIEDGRFYGCGIFDMKANIVVMLEALRFFTDTNSRPARPVTILLSCDEEVGSRTGRPLVEREAAAAESCFVLEPSFDGMAKTGRKGTGMYTLHARGIPAHAGLEPGKGASAILEIAGQIPKVHGLGDIEKGTTVNVCTAAGGTATNVIPEHAECTIDVRFTSAAEASRVDSAIRNLLPMDSRVSLEVLGDINRPPMERTEAVIALYEKARSFAESIGYELNETQVGGASDGNFVGALGIPVLDGLGISGAGAHRLDEHILVDDIAERMALVTLLLSDQMPADQ